VNAPILGSLLKPSEAAELLNVKLKTLSTWIARRQIDHVRLNAKTVRISRASLEAWLASRTVQQERGR
jgi:excisionase family DNA binding protein